MINPSAGTESTRGGWATSHRYTEDRESNPVLEFDTAEGVFVPTHTSKLLFCTQSTDYVLPTTACIVQDRLKLPTQTAAFDFNLGCSGFVYGLAIAGAMADSRQRSQRPLIGPFELGMDGSGYRDIMVPNSGARSLSKGSKVIRDLETIGNTVSSTIPIALKRAADDGKLTRGQLIRDER